MNTSFDRSINGKDEWLTPPYILNALGTFDLDPCSPINRPWDTAKQHLTVEHNGLLCDWGSTEVRVWCNPPYGKETGLWLNKCALHGNAMALIFARTETDMFFRYVWGKATAVLFLKGRIAFYHVSGKKGMSAGAPSVLVAYGNHNAEILRHCDIKGKFLQL